MKYVYIIEYDGSISKRGYETIEEAMEHLKNQGYTQNYGLTFRNDSTWSKAKIYIINLY